MRKNLLRLSDLEKAQLEKLRDFLMKNGLDIIKEIGLEAPKDFSYGGLVKLCVDALMKYLNENKK